MEVSVLPTHRFLWTSLCIHPVDESADKWKKWTIKLFASIAFLSHLSLIAASAMYITEFLWIDLEVSLYAAGQIFTFFPMIFMIPIGIIRRHKILAVFEKLREIHIKCK